MRLTQNARLTAASALLFLATACGDSNGPTTFDASGTSADVAAVDDVFSSPVLDSYSAFSLAMAGTVEAPAVSVAGLLTPSITGSPALGQAATVYGEGLAALLRRNPAFSASSGAIPPAALGVTFTWNTATSAYEPSDRTGAPANGARFMLYAVDPVTHQIVEPLNETGYVDVLDLSSGTTQSAQVKLVSGTTTYLDYTATLTANATGGVETVKGYLTDGTTRANFNLRNTVVLTQTDAALTLVYQLDVPTRQLSIDYTIHLTGLFSGTPQLTLDLSLSGQNGDVTLSGSETQTGGTYTVKVNGKTFATVSVDAQNPDPVVTGANGGSLTPEEQSAFADIYMVVARMFEVFNDLLQPAESLLGGATL